MNRPDPSEILRGLQRPPDRDAAGPSGAGAEATPDLTFAGYVETHGRVPAFEGSDGEAYTVDVDAEKTGDPRRPWAGFLVFVRWAATGAGIMGHITSENVAYGKTETEARAAVLGFSLYQVKNELDRAITRHRDLMEDQC